MFDACCVSMAGTAGAALADTAETAKPIDPSNARVAMRIANSSFETPCLKQRRSVSDNSGHMRRPHLKDSRPSPWQLMVRAPSKARRKRRQGMR
jgi:hypothetical protein